MTVKFSKNALKFLENIDAEIREKIREKLKQLLLSLEISATIPFNELDIKKLKGNWEGFYRLRIGKIRVIFTVDPSSSEIDVYAIGFRGDIY